MPDPLLPGQSEAPQHPRVYLIEDESAIRLSCESLLGSVGCQIESFVRADAFLSRWNPELPSCLVVDVRLPGMSGLELVERLRKENHQIPVIVMTGYADVPMAVRAMKLGALEFLQKPFNEQELLDLVHRALEADTQRRQREEEHRQLHGRLERLNAREREVLALVVAGEGNKQIAAQLRISIKTVEGLRSRIMAKLEASSVAELVRLSCAAQGNLPLRKGKPGK